MKALVTGGTGFLGGRLARRLQALGWSVTALGRSLDEGRRLVEDGIVFAAGDVRDGRLVDRLCVGQDAVFHCAALSAPWGAYRDFYETNVGGTEHVLAGCRRAGGPRLIYVSTPSVLFGHRDRLSVAEYAAPSAAPVNAYARTKLLAERAVALASAAGQPVVTVRPRAIFGPGDRTIFPRLIAANRRRGVPLIGGGQALLDLTYVDNAVDALLLCQAAPAATVLGRTFHITNGEPVPFAAALRELFTLLGEPLRELSLPLAAAYGIAAALELAALLTPGRPEPLLTRAVVSMLGRSQTLDVSAARRDLGYTPKISVRDGLAAYARWWRACKS
ncbi:NAD-dependent epimerase/dehydratase family protein [Paenibacillus athensensis]|uniref:3-beta hydroxysteroid dehydrogenase n=1 Tax=Paenibacillus athensensis TaxID=1967502 RepID=A0A4Y8Q3T9_9BACL|nr:NAD-dependent epimerase/dehydratase family protein [Paenibacillus athensensis]MCD1258473.1 NAD-dependent epimerase/dehydratase family protein [Paenibacillus athensensis]